jgi:hypothetical protein
LNIRPGQWGVVSAKHSAQDTDTYLTCGIDDITVVVNTLVADTLGGSVLDSRVVGLDELVLSELHHEGRLAYCKDTKMSIELA